MTPSSFSIFLLLLSTAGIEYFTPNDLLYNRHSVQMNTLHNAQPLVITFPTSIEQIQVIVKAASNFSAPIVVRATSHDYNGRSTGNGKIMIDMRHLDAISFVEGGNLRVQAGSNFMKIYEAASRNNRVAVGGHDPTVGLAGWVLGGGGHGALSRQYGLGVDNVLSLSMITPQGDLINVNEHNEHAALFTALKGGGANTFGVVTEFVIKTYPAPPRVLSLYMKWDDPMLSLVRFFHNLTWWEELSPTWSGWVVGQGSKDAGANLLYTGELTSDKAALQLLGGLTEFNDPEFVLVNYTSLVEYSVINADQTNWRRQFISNVLVPADQKSLDKVTNWMKKNPLQSWFNNFVFGGATNPSDPSPSAIPELFRSCVFEFGPGNDWLSPREDDTRMKLASIPMKEIYDISPQSYANEYTSFGEGNTTINPMPNWKTRFFSNYEKLLPLKKKYDPDNLFSVQYGIGYTIN